MEALPQASCSREGCKIGATVVPKVRIPAEGAEIGRHTPADMILDLPLCDLHSTTFSLQDVFTGPHRETIAACLRQVKRAPDFARAWIEWLDYHGREYRAFVKRWNDNRAKARGSMH